MKVNTDLRSVLYVLVDKLDLANINLHFYSWLTDLNDTIHCSVFFLNLTVKIECNFCLFKIKTIRDFPDISVTRFFQETRAQGHNCSWSLFWVPTVNCLVFRIFKCFPTSCLERDVAARNTKTTMQKRTSNWYSC